MTGSSKIPHRYIVISPAKDESRYIERTIVSMLRQTVLPEKWVVVDDGSRDRTLRIVQEYAEKHAWIYPVAIHRDEERKPGSHEIRAFYVGYDLVREEECDFLVKLDADLELPVDYFERLFSQFNKDPVLGIASGMYIEERDGVMSPVKMPFYHASGASKVIRHKCFQDIGGFPLSPGWDTADEIKAIAKGWRTKNFPEISFLHLRPEGSAIGLLKTCADHGRMYHACGGGVAFLLVKVIGRLVSGRPRFTGGAALLFGYISAAMSGQAKLVSKAEARCYRKLLNQRLTNHVMRLNLFGRTI